MLRSHVSWAFWDEVRFRERKMREGVEVELPSKHSRFFEYMDARGWYRASTKTEFSPGEEVFPILVCFSVIWLLSHVSLLLVFRLIYFIMLYV